MPVLINLALDVAIALDVASSHFYDEAKGIYHLHSEDRSLSSEQMIDMLEKWTQGASGDLD